MQNNSIVQRSGFGSLTDLPCFELHYQGATVVVAPYGAQVLSYQNAKGRELFWLSKTALWQGNKAIRGGVPICWPWFGKAAAEFGAKAEAMPNHGLVRTLMWQVTEQRITEDEVAIRFAIELPALPWLEQQVRLEYLVSLADQLSLELQCKSPLLQQAALHSYFQLPQSQGASVSPLPPSCYDKVSNSQLQLPTTSLVFQGEIDRVYKGTTELLTLQAPEQHHADEAAAVIKVQQQGHDASVLWNPGAEKSSAMVDMHQGASDEFVCVETAKLQLSAEPLCLRQIICG
ncbi:D-hexose-6-phosphate mutarotase [Rheinheimera sp. 4Y26]|uniref:aldose epimerase family protein n=1 Tax=Rheinheimera sp. 4Y26 TaxID=2977811 RepID=UPI0021B0C8A9|nr:D-hexose-6-phosphate mutarotase [Rheinheimera sp. 4Y26]MCT6700693.1 D-hexose-6-phosphate mutarotase [Rheinheimera sp. 4Y26]